MNYLNIGKIVNTHGVKGEIRIISDFKYKGDVFKKGTIIYIGEEKQKETINSYRKHKQYDMITLNSIDNINDVLKYKGEEVYISNEETNISGPLTEDLIGKKAYQNNKLIGKITEIRKNPGNDLLVINKNTLVPLVEELVIIENDKVIIKDMDGLI